MDTIKIRPFWAWLTCFWSVLICFHVSNSFDGNTSGMFFSWGIAQPAWRDHCNLVMLKHVRCKAYVWPCWKSTERDMITIVLMIMNIITTTTTTIIIIIIIIIMKMGGSSKTSQQRGRGIQHSCSEVGDFIIYEDEIPLVESVLVKLMSQLGISLLVSPESSEQAVTRDAHSRAERPSCTHHPTESGSLPGCLFWAILLCMTHVQCTWPFVFVERVCLEGVDHVWSR